MRDSWDLNVDINCGILNFDNTQIKSQPTIEAVLALKNWERTFRCLMLIKCIPAHSGSRVIIIQPKEEPITLIPKAT